MNSDSGYIKSLDGLRAIAIILVMSFHAEITHFGWLGVQLFFVLSGFLITGILWKEKQTNTPLSFKFKKFWIRRSLRIFPLYFGYLICISLSNIFFHFPPHYSQYQPYLFTYTLNYTRAFAHTNWQGDPSFTHLWSLSVEEQFYLFFPVIIFLLPSKFIKYLMLIVIAASPLTRFVLGVYYNYKGLVPTAMSEAIYWNTLSHFDAFFMGGIIPVLSLHKKIKRPLLFFIMAFAIVIVAGVFNFIYTDSGSYYFNDLGYNYGQTKFYEYVWYYSGLNFLFASFILCIVSIHSNKIFASVRKALESNWMVRIGKVSYGMYVFHWVILVYICNKIYTTENTGLKILIFIPYVFIVYLLAELSFRLYESPFLKLKDSLFTKKGNKRTQILSTVTDPPSVLKPISNEQ